MMIADSRPTWEGRGLSALSTNQALSLLLSCQDPFSMAQASRGAINLSDKCEAGSHSYVERVKLIADRMTQYQNFFKEFVKYSARAQHSSKSMQKALELCTSIPQRVHDLEFTKNITQYPGDTNKLGRIIRHDAFQVWEGDEDARPRYVFLFRNKLDKYSVRTHTTDEDTIVLQPNEPGLPSFRMKPKDLSNAEYVRKAWIRDIAEEHEAYAACSNGWPTRTSFLLGSSGKTHKRALSQILIKQISFARRGGNLAEAATGANETPPHTVSVVNCEWRRRSRASCVSSQRESELEQSRTVPILINLISST
ncbi:unnamed protein product [Caenorhabditis auriculariae]|uniref:PH domain-containing protein n=1 Tax=Caenorhabditis auriculariae TaxID=2777116 RepID=A0A8S1H2U7_9PELO|nr:unnamed protein product [Caenorhabditis auriculariae]